MELIRSPKRKVVLKFGNQKAIKRDFNAYKKCGNRYFAKIYWHTKYCMLQKYGANKKIPEDELKRLKTIAKEKYGLIDIKEDNIRKVDGIFKIVDANVKSHAL